MLLCEKIALVLHLKMYGTVRKLLLTSFSTFGLHTDPQIGFHETKYFYFQICSKNIKLHYKDVIFLSG